MKATPEMIAAGAQAARKYMDETGGNNPAAIVFTIAGWVSTLFGWNK